MSFIRRLRCKIAGKVFISAVHYSQTPMCHCTRVPLVRVPVRLGISWPYCLLQNFMELIFKNLEGFVECKERSSSRRQDESRFVKSILHSEIAPLWGVKECAFFLRRSERWVWDALRCDPNKAGSLPFIRIPGGRGCRHGQGSPRFLADEIRAWAAEGCPPAAIFKAWQKAERKRLRRTG